MGALGLAAYRNDLAETGTTAAGEAAECGGA